MKKTAFLENKEIDLVLFDTRVITTNSKVECESEIIIENLTNLIRKTYPSANFFIR